MRTGVDVDELVDLAVGIDGLRALCGTRADPLLSRVERNVVDLLREVNPDEITAARERVIARASSALVGPDSGPKRPLQNLLAACEPKPSLDPQPVPGALYDRLAPEKVELLSGYVLGWDTPTGHEARAGMLHLLVLNLGLTAVVQAAPRELWLAALESPDYQS